MNQAEKRSLNINSGRVVRPAFLPDDKARLRWVVQCSACHLLNETQLDKHSTHRDKAQAIAKHTSARWGAD